MISAQHFVYILISEKDHKLYVGCTSNLQTRLSAHNKGLVTATKNRRPLFIIYSEEFKDADEAYKREKYLKSLWSARFKENLKKEYLQNVAQ